MTGIQIIALIALIIGAAILYWTGYRGGLIDGRIEGLEERKTNQLETADPHKLLARLERLCQENRRLGMCYSLARAAAKLGEADRQTLLDIAELLRIAAETFSAFRTGKKLHRDALALREKAIAMAALLEPTATSNDRGAIRQEENIALPPREAKAAQSFFQKTAMDTQLKSLNGSGV